MDPIKLLNEIHANPEDTKKLLQVIDYLQVGDVAALHTQITSLREAKQAIEEIFEAKISTMSLAIEDQKLALAKQSKLEKWTKQLEEALTKADAYAFLLVQLLRDKPEFKEKYASQATMEMAKRWDTEELLQKVVAEKDALEAQVARLKEDLHCKTCHNLEALARRQEGILKNIIELEQRHYEQGGTEGVYKDHETGDKRSYQLGSQALGVFVSREMIDQITELIASPVAIAGFVVDRRDEAVRLLEMFDNDFKSYSDDGASEVIGKIKKLLGD